MNHLVAIRTLIAAARRLSEKLTVYQHEQEYKSERWRSDGDAIEAASYAIVSAEKLIQEGRKPGELASDYLDRVEDELARRFAAELAFQPLRGVHVGVDLASGVSETTLCVTGKDSTTQDPPLVKLGPGGDYTREYRPVSCLVFPPNAYLPTAKLPPIGGVIDTKA